MSARGSFVSLESRRGSARDQPGFFFRPEPFGPAFDQPGLETIVIKDGALAGTRLRLEARVSANEAHFRLHDKELAARVDFELGTKEAKVLLWDTVVRPELRGKGLASLVIRIGLRRLLRGFEDPVDVGIREVKLIDSEHDRAEIKNIGMGVIARQLGMSFDPQMLRALRQDNIASVEVVTSGDGTLPGYRIMLKKWPLTLIAIPTSPDTGRPLTNGSLLYSLSVTPVIAAAWAKDPSIIFGNGDYKLRRSGVAQFVNRLAANAAEATWLFQHIKAAD